MSFTQRSGLWCLCSYSFRFVYTILFISLFPFQFSSGNQPSESLLFVISHTFSNCTLSTMHFSSTCSLAPLSAIVVCSLHHREVLCINEICGYLPLVRSWTITSSKVEVRLGRWIRECNICRWRMASEVLLGVSR